MSEVDTDVALAPDQGDEIASLATVNPAPVPAEYTLQAYLAADGDADGDDHNCYLWGASCSEAQARRMLSTGKLSYSEVVIQPPLSGDDLEAAVAEAKLAYTAELAERNGAASVAKSFDGSFAADIFWSNYSEHDEKSDEEVAEALTADLPGVGMSVAGSLFQGMWGPDIDIDGFLRAAEEEMEERNGVALSERRYRWHRKGDEALFRGSLERVNAIEMIDDGSADAAPSAPTAKEHREVERDLGAAMLKALRVASVSNTASFEARLGRIEEQLQRLFEVVEKAASKAIDEEPVVDLDKPDDSSGT